MLFFLSVCAVNLRKSFGYKSIINYIGMPKAKNQTKRYRLFSTYLYFLGPSYRNTAKAKQICRKESCLHLEMDSKIQTKENFNKDKQDQWIYYQ